MCCLCVRKNYDEKNRQQHPVCSWLEPGAVALQKPCSVRGESGNKKAPYGALFIFNVFVFLFWTAFVMIDRKDHYRFYFFFNGVNDREGVFFS